MSSERVKCEICGEEVHSIAIHLKAAHGAESSAPCSFEKYREQYPTAPILSRIAQEHLNKKSQAAKVESESSDQKDTPAAEQSKEGSQTQRVAFHEAFKFGKSVKAAFTKTGNPIAATRDCRSDEYDYLVPEWSENYILNPELAKTVLMGIELRTPTYLYGHSGVGKSSIFKQICAGLNRRLFRFQHTIDTEESHIVGQWVVRKHVDANGNAVSVTEFELGPLPTAMMNGWIYLADEIDRSSPTVLSAYQAILEGEPLIIKNAPPHLRVIKPHSMFSFAATGNTNGTGDESGLYQATVVQDAATIERFGIVAYVDYPPEKQEIAMISAATGIHQEDAKRVRQFAHEIRTKAFPHQVSLTLGPRVAINIARIALMKGDFNEGVAYAFANRLPESERAAATSLAKRIFA